MGGGEPYHTGISIRVLSGRVMIICRRGGVIGTEEICIGVNLFDSVDRFISLARLS